MTTSLMMLQAIRSNGERLLTLVDDMATRSPARQPGEPLVAPLVDVGSIVEDVADRWSERGASRGLVVGLVIDEPAPARVDPMGLARLLDKLFDNAMMTTAQGGVVVTVLGPSAADAGATIIVEDTSHQPADVEQFGLSVARAFARTLGCRLTAERMADQGTRVTIDFCH
jgi:signal transduction histidine kinase